MITPPKVLDNICTTLIAADAEAAAVLLVVLHPEKIAEPVFVTRQGSGWDSFGGMAKCLRTIADQIDAAHKATEGKLP